MLLNRSAGYNELIEYITALPNPVFQALRQSLPRYIDDIEAEIGEETYDQMMRDDQVKSDVETLILAILADGIQVMPAVDPVTPGRNVDAEYESDAKKAGEFAKFVDRCLDGMRDGRMVRGKALLSAIFKGHALAEILPMMGTGIDKGKLVLKDLAPKPRKNVGLVVDELGNLVGVIGIMPGEDITSLPTVFTISDEMYAKMLPLEKFVIFINDASDGSLAGESILRAAYSAWFIKKHILPSWHKFLYRFGQPKVVGQVAEKQEFSNVIDPKTGEMLFDAMGDPRMRSAVYDLLMLLQGWQDVLAVPYGTDVQLLEPQSDGQAFISACDYFNRAISKSILGTAQVTMEAQHESRSSKGVGQDVFGLRVAWFRLRLGEVLTRSVSVFLTVRNFGEDQKRLAPRIVLSKSEQQDVAEMMKAFATARASDLLPDFMLPEIWSRLGFEFDVDQWKAEREAKQQREDAMAGDLGKALNPTNQNDPNQEDVPTD